MSASRSPTLSPRPRERDRKVRRDGGFADPALPARNRNYVLGPLEPDPARLFAKLGFDSMHPKFDLRHAEFVGKRMMDFRGEIANHFLALSHLPNRDRKAAVGFRRCVFNDSKRNDVRRETGILDVSQCLDNRILCYLSHHECDYRR